MDRGAQYTKMCEQAGEIQSLKPDGSQGEFVFCEGEAYLEVDDRPLTPFTWLPRQDQLQEMMGNQGRVVHPPFYFVGDLYHFYFDGGREGNYAETMEQLWLAFVMKENYNKVWNGEEWIEMHSFKS